MDRNGTIRSLFGADRALIGMVHLQALPGSPACTLPVAAMVEKAVEEAELYRQAGFNGVAIENMHDRPYFNRNAGPEVVAAMTAAARAIRAATGLPLGVQVLAGANREALAVAQAAEACFVRVEGFVYAHVADEGLMQADAARLLRYRKTIGAESIRIFADIKKKHSSHALTADVNLAETAETAEFCLADGVVVTGSATGRPTDPDQVEAVHNVTSIPTLVGSGVTPENMPHFQIADALIVGSSSKFDGLWSNEIDPSRLEALVRSFDRTTGPA